MILEISESANQCLWPDSPEYSFRDSRFYRDFISIQYIIEKSTLVYGKTHSDGWLNRTVGKPMEIIMFL
jgi:hypothetical protein